MNKFEHLIFKPTFFQDLLSITIDLILTININTISSNRMCILRHIFQTSTKQYFPFEEKLAKGKRNTVF